MKFEEALTIFRNNRKIRQKNWDQGEYICLTNPGDDYFGRMFNADWEEYKEYKFKLTFNGAMEALKNGLKVRRERWVDCYVALDENYPNLIQHFWNNAPRLRFESYKLIIDDYEANDWGILE